MGHPKLRESSETVGTPTIPSLVQGMPEPEHIWARLAPTTLTPSYRAISLISEVVRFDSESMKQS